MPNPDLVAPSGGGGKAYNYYYVPNTTSSLFGEKISEMDRKAELERKKAKLAMLREEKDRRRREKEQKDIEEAATRGGNAISGENRRDLDEMLSSLGVAPVSEVLSSLSSVGGTPDTDSANQTPDGSLQPASSTA